jgi:biopolymer transport protein ExbB
MKRRITLAAVLVMLLPAVVFAASWWNGSWKYRKEIGFDFSSTGADIAQTTRDLPVLVRLSLANFSYFNDTKPDGSDFRIVAADDKTPLKFHFEKYDAQNQMALLWVRVPQIAGGSKDEHIFAYYGNPDAPDAGDTAGTYDASQVLVLSFSDGANPPTDLTAYKNNPSQSTAALTPASLIGGGAKFSGKELITIPATASLRLLPNQGLTASAWVRMDQAQQATVFALSDANKSLAIDVDGDKFVARASFGADVARAIQTSGVTLGQWHHVAVTAGAQQLTLYVDGASVGSTSVNLQEIGGEFTVGGVEGARFLNGDVDEVEVAKAVRSADWIKASARSQGIDSNLVTFGADGQREGGGQNSYFVAIAKNLTLDGWVVIGICMAMLAIALVIMVAKAVILRRIEISNAHFLRKFQETHTSIDGSDVLATEGAEFGASTLFRLYEHGLMELNKRLDGQTVSAQRTQVLSPQSIEAMRAALDAAMTRLQQRLSSRMVLLTIAISGGPFLGLLGTVIGVMITFAAIALSGDVNVNAIAPGIAAALAATVAGLAVAIPALFGYNWLNSRIKSISADNRVFVDEFVARIAEQYS